MTIHNAIAALSALDEHERAKAIAYVLAGLEPVEAVAVQSIDTDTATVTLADGRTTTPDMLDWGLGRVTIKLESDSVEPEDDQGKRVIVSNDHSEQVVCQWVAEVGTQIIPVTLPEGWDVEQW